MRKPISSYLSRSKKIKALLPQQVRPTKSEIVKCDLVKYDFAKVRLLIGQNTKSNILSKTVLHYSL